MMPKEQKPNETSLVRLRTFLSTQQAVIVQGMLENHDIPCLLVDGTSSVYPMINTNIGEAVLYVNPHHAARAAQILEEAGV